MREDISFSKGDEPIQECFIIKIEITIESDSTESIALSGVQLQLNISGVLIGIDRDRSACVHRVQIAQIDRLALQFNLTFLIAFMAQDIALLEGERAEFFL